MSICRAPPSIKKTFARQDRLKQPCAILIVGTADGIARGLGLLNADSLSPVADDIGVLIRGLSGQIASCGIHA